MTTAVLSPFAEYIAAVGGRDILLFATAAEASDAAHALRDQNGDDEIEVKASYNKVFISIKEG